MTTKQLGKLNFKLYKLREALKKASAADPDLKPIFDLADKAWMDTHHLRQRRELENAKKADRGEVCWTLCRPREYGWEPNQFIQRTPHLRLDHTFSLAKPHEYLAAEKDPWRDLEKEWKPVDLAKVRARAERIDKSWPAERHRLACIEEAA